ncbi:DUF418 domain-containing protein [Bacillus sp. FJAT-49736]|uniref:DUF418 domain-containing protein n=1 Tax=Bacillus sp. FJAT-49736 TaxID=2833582 RepID=UPI001BCA0EC9|nr:DUF418 domain-containing protein [Bacillus sp. FJAT-49736]MBS4172014.1 DUF418 domain-containing protein [Bacillus sp. FJAT-49736]
MELQMKSLQKNERIFTLDVLRGFSLLGILIINMISFNAPVLYYNPYEWWQNGDATLYKWIEILIESSFYPIFAMMFGYGSVILRNRIKQKGLAFSNVYLRRLLFLLVIGLLHAFFIWSGDILVNYAIYGMILMVLLELSGEVLIISGVMLFLVPNLLFILYIMVNALFDPNTTLMYADITNVNKSVNAYSTGSYWEITQQRFADWSAVNGSANLFFSVFSILPLMLIGAGASKLKWLQRAKEQKKKWMVIFIVSLVIGILLKSLPALVDSNLAFKLIQQSLGGTIFSFAIVALIVLLMINKVSEKLFRPIATAGRMSLTIYLIQSIVGTLIFYHYGMDFYGKLTLSSCILMALLIYFIQVILAEIWFMKFQNGPLEKIWRIVTYWK